MRVLLIEPPFNRLYHERMSLNKLPLSLGYLASAVKKHTNHDVLIYNSDFAENSIDYTFSFLAGEGYDNYIRNLADDNYIVWKEIENTIRDYKPDIVGITSKSQNFASACRVAQITKQYKAEITTVLGGPHPSLVGEDSLECENFDIAVRGEGEEVFVELLQKIEARGSFSDVMGVCYRSNGKVVSNHSRRQIEILDTLDHPYLHVKELLKDYKYYPSHSFRSIFAIRGCPYNCTFCGSGEIWQRKVRFRSPKDVVEEILFLREMDVHYFNFDDDTFGVTPKYLRELCEKIEQECKGVKWSCELHVKLITDDNLRLMKRAGCDLIKIGIESGNNEILKEIGKNITIQEAINASKRIRKHDMFVMAFFMVGFPQDTEQTLQDTIIAIKKIPGFVTYSIFTPYQGTDAYSLCEREGLIPENFDVSLFNHQSPKNCFNKNLPHVTFREIVSEVESLVDKKNAFQERLNKVRRFYPNNMIRKIIGKGF